MPLSVIGAGFGRTGTMSLKLALDQLGFGPTYHMIEVFQNPAAPDYWSAVADNQPVDWEVVFKGYSSTVDWPSATYYKRLADDFPDAKVILTERDPEAWFTSTQATIFKSIDQMPPSPWLTMAQKVIGSLFDQKMHDHDTLISVFNRHNAEVRRLIPAERLLVYEVADGWAPLCEFLGVPVPEGPMPKVNTTEEFQARLGGVTAR